MNDDGMLGLPYWLTRPAPHTKTQPSLFRISLDEALMRLRISPDELTRWHAKGWTSFGASGGLDVDEFDDPKTWELCFVRDIVRSGLTDAQIAWLLETLPRPFAFNPDRIAFSFLHGWIEVVPCREPETSIDGVLDLWLETCDEGQLLSLRDKIEELLNAFKDSDAEIEA